MSSNPISPNPVSPKPISRRRFLKVGCLTGAAVEVAAAIGETLGARGFSVDVKPIPDKPPVDKYQAVLIGSAVHHGNWLPEAIDFVKANRPALNHVPVALFCVHIQNMGNDETSRQRRLAYLNEVRPLVQPIDEGFFAGRFNRRGAVLMLPGWLARLVPNIDLRNWESIRTWATNVSPLLQPA